MDRNMRTAMRGIYSTGQVVEMTVEMIKEMNPEDRRRIDNWLRFFREREQRHWRLGAGRDRYTSEDRGTKKFLIKDLPDSTILRLINTPTARRHWEHWTRYGKDESDQYNWNQEDHTYGRSTYAVVWEEAEYRGHMSNEQLYWESVREHPKVDVTIMFKILGKCDTRGSHEIVRVGDGVKCTDCRKGLTNEKVVEFATAKLRGRLRKFASGLHRC